MKKIYESQLNGWDESAERIYIYTLENDEEYWDFYDMTFDERCEYFGVCDDSDYFVMPGAKYYTYGFYLTPKHIIMKETMAYNV